MPSPAASRRVCVPRGCVVHGQHPKPCTIGDITPPKSAEKPTKSGLRLLRIGLNRPSGHTHGGSYANWNVQFQYGERPG
jgi:hypothetical protein